MCWNPFVRIRRPYETHSSVCVFFYYVETCTSYTSSQKCRLPFVTNELLQTWSRRIWMHQPSTWQFLCPWFLCLSYENGGGAARGWLRHCTKGREIPVSILGRAFGKFLGDLFLLSTFSSSGVHSASGRNELSWGKARPALTTLPSKLGWKTQQSTTLSLHDLLREKFYVLGKRHWSRSAFMAVFWNSRQPFPVKIMIDQKQLENAESFK